MIENILNYFVDIEKGSEVDAFEAAKKIACNKLSNTELIRLSNVATEGLDIHNKEAATYAISWVANKSLALATLIGILNSLQNHERVRGRAAEGIGLIRPSRKYKMRMDAEKVLLNSLNDPSPTVRFWSCYAVGELKMKSALLILKELRDKDDSICPGWWYVSEEAEDAIAKINKREWKDRIPVNQRNSGIE